MCGIDGSLRFRATELTDNRAGCLAWPALGEDVFRARPLSPCVGVAVAVPADSSRVAPAERARASRSQETRERSSREAPCVVGWDAIPAARGALEARETGGEATACADERVSATTRPYYRG